MTDSLTGLDALGTAAAVRDGEVSAREVVEAAIDRIRAADPTLNTVVAERFDAALAEVDAGLPQGPLTGVPTLVKDLGMRVAGLPATRGSRLWADDVATVDSELVARYRRAGMVVLGMSNAPELGKNASTEPVLHGATRNPWSPAHSAGGSSGGSAAAVSAGLVPVAHGNDGGGSIRIPAAMCGLFGLKPSRGRVTPYPEPSTLSQPLSINHALTRTVRDSAVLLDVATAPFPGPAIGAPGDGTAYADHVGRDPGRLRIGLVTARPDGQEVSREVLDATIRAARVCEEVGHEVVEVQLGHDHGALMEAFATLMGTSLLAQVDHRLAELDRGLREDDLEPFTRLLHDHYRPRLTATDVYDALAGVETAAWQVGRYFTDVDLLMSPTLPLPVPHLGWLDTTDPAAMWQRGGDYSAFTALFNVTGSPGMSVPFGQDTAGLPIGVQLVAGLGGEGTLLALAAQLEEAAPWPHLAPDYR